MSSQRRRLRLKPRHLLVPVFPFAAVITISACEVGSLLEVSDPNRILAENAEDPASAGTLAAGVAADFECAFGAYVVSMGALSDELEDRAFVGDRWFMDRRDVTSRDIYATAGCTDGLPGVYTPVSTARWLADNTFQLLQSWANEEVSDRGLLMARTALYAGFSYSLMATAMCSAALDGGPELSSSELFALSEERFTTALDIARGEGLSTIQSAARVGRSRVRLYQGDGAGALSDAQGVPAGFVFYASASDQHERRHNRVYEAIRFDLAFGVQPESRGLMTGGVEDPRTRSFDSGSYGPDGAATVWFPEKHLSRSSPIPIARWAEAQLIIAEIRGGQVAVDIINALRDRYDLPHFGSTDESEIQEMVVAERRRELFLEGHRAYDIRRLNLPLNPPPGAPYQVGVKGGTYGDSRCLPLPDVERDNNPSIN